MFFYCIAAANLDYVPFANGHTPSMFKCKCFVYVAVVDTDGNNDGFQGRVGRVPTVPPPASMDSRVVKPNLMDVQSSDSILMSFKVSAPIVRFLFVLADIRHHMGEFVASLLWSRFLTG